MRTQESVFRITPKSRQLIARAGRAGLFKSVFSITKAPSDEGNVVVKHSRLLLASSYVNLEEAHERTGISKHKLQELCEDGKLDAKKSNDDWLILWESIEEYLERAK